MMIVANQHIKQPAPEAGADQALSKPFSVRKIMDVAQSVLSYGQPLPFPVKSSVYRIVQECIQNSLKHAEATIIHIRLEERQGLWLELHDNGKGFDTAASYTGAGLHNMKRRANLAGGECSIRSEPGKGTTLELFIDNQYLFP